MNELDKLIWLSLTGAHKTFAESGKLVHRYLPSITALSALAEESREAVCELAQLLKPGERAGLFLENLLLEKDQKFDIPAVEMRSDELVNQMECRELKNFAGSGSKYIWKELTPSDIPEMTALAKATQPGPFGSRTIELGNYIGMRNEVGELIAMGGHRCQTDNFTEVSAVCVHPDYRGRGLAKDIVFELSRRIIEAGKKPCLHVRATNENAIRSYLPLGFSIRRAFKLTVMTRLASGPLC